MDDENVTIEAHITKITKKVFERKYHYFYPPRIGLDFYEEYPDGPHDFIANLELGDIIRLIKILELIEKDSIFKDLNSGDIKPFTIGLSFESDLKRKIRIDADEGDVLTYINSNSIRLG